MDEVPTNEVISNDRREGTGPLREELINQIHLMEARNNRSINSYLLAAQMNDHLCREYELLQQHLLDLNQEINEVKQEIRRLRENDPMTEILEHLMELIYELKGTIQDGLYMELCDTVMKVYNGGL